MQIGQANRTGGNNSTEFLGHPADLEVDAATNEVYVADGVNGSSGSKCVRCSRAIVSAPACVSIQTAYGR